MGQPNLFSKTKALWERLAKKEYRHAYVAASIENRLAAQIFALRNQREWNQSELAQRSGMLQPRVSKLEDSCNNVTISTLKRLASAFDVALSVKFVPFKDFVRDEVRSVVDKACPAFADDSQPENGANFNPLVRATTMHWIAQVTVSPLAETGEMRYPVAIGPTREFGEIHAGN